MTTATKKREAAPSAAKPVALLNRGETDAADIYESAEAILIACYREDQPADPCREPDPREMTILRTAFGPRADDPLFLQQQIGRAAKARRFMRQAGTPAELEHAQKTLADAVSVDESEGSQIDAQIRELQAARTKLQQTRAERQRIVDGMTAARNALRDPTLLPEHVLAFYNHAKRYRNSEFRQPVETIENEIAAIDRIASLPPDSVAAFNHANMLHQELLNSDEYGKFQRSVNRAAWQRYVAGLQAERADLEKRLAPLQEALAGAQAEVDRHLNFYLNQLVDR